MPRPSPTSGLAVWRPTAAYLRAVGVGGALVLASVLTGRPNLVVLALPLIVLAGWARLLRPASTPTVQVRTAPARLRETGTAQWTAQILQATGTEHAVADLDHDEWLVPHTSAPAVGLAPHRPEPAPGPSQDRPAPGQTERALQLGTTMRPLRWGTRRAGPALVSLTSAFGAYRFTAAPHTSQFVTVLPQPAVFDGSAPVPHPSGLVGPDRGRRLGDGTEFAGIRPFQVGDRLRRVHWPVSLRTGQLQVVTTYTDQDSEIVLVVDALGSVGGGPDGTASSLATSVRAAGALAEHHLRRGDRVALTTVGGPRPVRIPARSGTRHATRLLEALSGLEPMPLPRTRRRRLELGIRGGSFVLAVTPVLSDELLGVLLGLVGRGLTVVAVDTLPDPGDLGPGDLRVATEPGDPLADLAWRLRLLEREAAVRRLQAAGVAVVRWAGPGSLDPVLRQIGARGGRPSAVRR